jgi:hypothetical protein
MEISQSISVNLNDILQQRLSRVGILHLSSWRTGKEDALIVSGVRGEKKSMQLLSFLLLATSCLAIYQDQAGVADFSQRLVGIPDWQFLGGNRLILVSSSKNTISSINPTNGSIGKFRFFLI